MNLQVIIIAAVTIALLGTIIGASMVAVDQQKNLTDFNAIDQPPPTYRPPSRRRIFLPMVICLGISLALMIIGYQTGNIIGFIVGFLLLFIGFGLLGAFLMGR